MLINPNSPSKVRAVIAEDHAMFRGLLSSFLQHNGVDVIAQTSDPAGLIEATRSTRPDLALIDIHLPPGSGTEGLRAAHQIRRESPTVGIMLLSKYVQTQYLADLLASGQGKVGYWLKESIAELDEFRIALSRVLAGECVLDPQVVAAMLAKPQARTRLSVLTPRQLEVLQLMAEGLSNTEIKSRLYISEGTLEDHIRAIYSRLELGDKDDTYVRRSRAILIYLQTYGSGNS